MVLVTLDYTSPALYIATGLHFIDLNYSNTVLLVRLAVLSSYFNTIVQASFTVNETNLNTCLNKAHWVRFFCCLLAAQRPCHTLVYFTDGSGPVCTTRQSETSEVKPTFEVCTTDFLDSMALPTSAHVFTVDRRSKF